MIALLYKYTVQFIIYRLRAGGQRIPGSDPALRSPLRGDLQLLPASSDEPRLRARLIDSAGLDLTQPLEFARVVQIRGEAMHITGFEITSRTTKGRATKCRQSWLCVWDEVVALQLLARVQINSITGFSPEDDDAD
ncbi:hypothetical protein PSQ39_21495 [Curvibacter sp. HBC28]|uniref:Uncharacterized protein n=1 Tax=Curvibacter microcysteis TaxID=3026419 RepID=A0ABT5MKX7_9BURK|nr:hypothetical protein [Curvibacter sp. HBC28]MDD0817224.1 hypothetical protein [Curvibacter sp. HBC28]